MKDIIQHQLALAFESHEAAPTPQSDFEIAAALGQARLFAVALDPAYDGVLPAVMAQNATNWLAAAMPAWLEDVRKLDAGYDDKWRTEGDEDCISLLENRMSAWGALVAVEEAAARHAELAPTATKMNELGALFDRWLRSQVDELSAVVGLPMFDNWKASLAPQFREPLPWWLDGTLEAAAARIKKEAIAAMPSPELWRMIRERAMRPPGEAAE